MSNIEELNDKMEEIIHTIQDADEIDEIEEEFGDIKHPNIGYRIGSLHLIFEQKEKAFPYFINSACFGLSHDSPWFNTLYSDSISQSIYHLLTQYTYMKSFDDIKYKLFVNAYIGFSYCIEVIGTKAYDSLRYRALLLHKTKPEIVESVLKKYY